MKSIRASFLLAGLTLLAGLGQARYLFVLPPTGAANPGVTVYNEQLVLVGTFPLAAVPDQILVSNGAEKAIAISTNPQAPVTFISLQGGNPPVVRAKTLPNNVGAVAAAITPDGTRLLVLAGSNPGWMYVFDVATEQMQANGQALINAKPADVAVSPDSKYAYVVSEPVGSVSGQFSAVDLTTSQVVVKTLSELGGSGHVAVAPWGSVYVTGLFRIFEFMGAPPFDKTAQTGLPTFPGRIQFAPDGRYGLAENLNPVLGSSVLLFDFSLRDSENAAGTQTGTIRIPFPTLPAQQVTRLFVSSATEAIAYVSDLGKLFRITYPSLTVTELALASIGVPEQVAGAMVTNEFPDAKSLYLISNGQLSGFDLASGQLLGSTAAAAPGLIFAPAPASNEAATIRAFNTGGLIAPQTTRTLYLRVTDASGRPAFNRAIAATLVTGSATVNVRTPATNREGWAVVDVTPTAEGEFKVKVSVDAVVSNLVLAATSGGGGGGGGGGTPGLRILKVSGDGQMTEVAKGIFNEPLVVKVVDGEGKPVPNVAITWTPSDSSLSLFGANSSLTDENGVASISFNSNAFFQLDESFLKQTVEASIGVSKVAFTLVIYRFQQGSFSFQPVVQILKPDVVHFDVKLGVPVPAAFQALVVTPGGPGLSGGVPIPGIGMRVSTNFTDPTQGPVAHCEGDTPLSNEQGIVTCNLIVEGKTGTSPLKVVVGGLKEFQIYSITVGPGNPAAPILVSGDNQTGKTGQNLLLPLVARVTDGFGNILAGVPVTWTVVTPNSVTLFNTIVTSNDTGLVSTQVRLGNTAGRFQIKVAAAGQETVFEVVIESQAAGLAKVSGDNQPSAVINTQFSQPLVVSVTDAQSRPVAGAVVNWTVTGSATLSATSTVSGADGRAQVTVTAGSVAGAITVTATVPSIAPVSFSLQSRLPGPAITAASFTNYASGEAGVAPGNLVIITGTGLAGAVNGAVSANLLLGRLPLELGGVVVEFRSNGNSYYAPIYWVAKNGSNEAVLIQVPFEISGSTVDAVVSVSGGSTTVSNIPVRPVSPGIIEDIDPGTGRKAAIVFHADGNVVTPQNPARGGEEIRMYAIGLGQTTPQAETNRVGVPNQTVRASLAVGIDNAGVEVVSAQLAPNLIGIYEIRFKVPAGAAPGDRPFGLQVEAAPGQPAFAQPSVIAIGQ